jgi:hypothetical protein
MALESYNLDQIAHDLVLEYYDKGAYGQVYKMRASASYGLERFWGEQLRLYEKKQNHFHPTPASKYWQATWQKFCGFMGFAGIELPANDVEPTQTDTIQEITFQLWNFDSQQRKVALSVLIKLCDCMVWWSQRYKPADFSDSDENLEEDDHE